MTQAPPHGITPPAPGLEREEPDLWREDDIPSDESGKPAAQPGAGRAPQRPGAGELERK